MLKRSLLYCKRLFGVVAVGRSLAYTHRLVAIVVPCRVRLVVAAGSLVLFLFLLLVLPGLLVFGACIQDIVLRAIFKKCSKVHFPGFLNCFFCFWLGLESVSCCFKPTLVGQEADLGLG